MLLITFPLSLQQCFDWHIAEPNWKILKLPRHFIAGILSPWICRSRHWTCSARKGVLRNFEKFTGKHLRQSLFVNKVTGLRPAMLLKKRLWYRYFPVNFAKFPRTAFSQNTSWQLLLNLEGCVIKVSISASTVALFPQKKILKKGLYLLKSLVNWVFNLWKNIQTPCPSAPVIDHQILHQGLKWNSKNSVGKFKKIKLTWVSQFFTGGLNKASQIFT